MAAAGLHVVAGICRKGAAPDASAGARLQPDLRRDAVARHIHRSGIGHLASGNDRHFIAQSFGVVDDVSGKDDCRSAQGQLANHRFQLALIDRVEPAERFVQHHQLRAMHQRAEQLYSLRHALRQLADLPVDRMAHAVPFQQFTSTRLAFGQRQAAQCAHERDRIVAFHCGIQAAFLGQVADQLGNFVRTVVAEHAAHAFVGVDDAQQHPQCRRLACAVGAQNAVDRAFGHGNIHPVDSQRVVEALDQSARLDSERTMAVGRGSRHGACLGKHGRIDSGWQ